MTRLSRNLLYNLAGQFLLVSLGLVSVKFIYGRLGEDVFGIISFAQILSLTLVAALDLGISATTVREVSGHSQQERSQVIGLIKLASLLYWVASAGLAVAIVEVAPLLFGHWVNLRHLDRSSATQLIRILTVSVVVVLPRGLYRSVLQGLQRMGTCNALDVTAMASQQVGIFAIISAGGDAVELAMWISASSILGTIAYMVVVARKFGWRSLIPGFRSAVAKRNFRFMGHMTVVTTLSFIQTQAGRMTISKLMPVGDLGLYSFASSTVSRVGFLPSAVSQSVYPSLVALFKSGDRIGLLTQYRKVQTLVSIGMVPVFAGIIFASGPAYRYAFNEGAARQLLLPTAVLCVGSFMSSVLTMPYIVSLAADEPQIAARANIWSSIIVLPATVILVIWMGLLGAAVSWVVYHVFVLAYMVPAVCRTCLDMKAKTWYLEFSKVVAVAAFAYGIVWWSVSVVGARSVSGLIIAYCVGSALFAGGAYALMGSSIRLLVAAVTTNVTRTGRKRALHSEPARSHLESRD